MNGKFRFGLIRSAALLSAAILLLSTTQPAVAQSLAAEFNAILNGPNGVANRCRQLAGGQSATCDDYGITPTTDLQMRFAAPEEIAAQKSAVKEFSSQQLQSVAGRLGTLRMQTAGIYNSEVQRALLAENSFPVGGGAAANPEFGGIGSISGYATVSHGFGSRDQTAYEDEADYTGNDLILGADYRISRSFVVGAALGYTDKSIDLSSTYSDAATPTTINASATNDANGIGLTAYVQWEGEGLYANASLGGQWLDYDLVRRADYVTSAPTVSLTATASPKSTSLQGSATIGYVVSFGGFGIDTAANLQYQDVKTDEFQESGATCPSGACAGTDLNMRFAAQTVKSLEASLSVRGQYAITAGSLVWIPFVSAEYINQQEDDRYVIEGMYAPLFGLIPNFVLNTDAIDTEYYAVSAGLSFVARGGWQGFLRYRTTLELDNVSDSIIAAGVRFEF